MTKDEMVEKYSLKSPDNLYKNYQEAQKRIMEAMQRGEDYVYLPKESFCNEFTWFVFDETINRLIVDGFDINVQWNPFEYWSVEWCEN